MDELEFLWKRFEVDAAKIDQSALALHKAASSLTVGYHSTRPLPA